MVQASPTLSDSLPGERPNSFGNRSVAVFSPGKEKGLIDLFALVMLIEIIKMVDLSIVNFLPSFVIFPQNESKQFNGSEKR